MARRTPDKPGQDLLTGVAVALSTLSNPHDAAGKVLQVFRAAVPGLRAWILLRNESSSPGCRWTSGPGLGLPPPFPDALTSNRGSLAALALETGSPVVIEVGALPFHKAPETPYLRRMTGCWWLLPAGGAPAPGLLVLHHAELGALEGLAEPMAAATRLLHPHLSLLVLRRDTDRRIDERTSELALFYETSRALAFARTDEQIASLLAEHLGKPLGLEMLALLSLHPDRQETFVEVLGSPSLKSIRAFKRAVLKEGSALGGRERLPGSVRLLRSHRRIETEPSNVAADLHLPLAVGGRQLGVLSAKVCRAPLDESRMRLLYTVSSQTALTLERVRTVEEAGLLKMRAVLDSMTEGVLLIDRNLRIVLANPAARKHVEEIMDRPMSKRLIRLGDIALAPLMDALAAQGTAPSPVEIATSERQRIYQLSASPAYGLRSAFEGAVLVISDVTQQRRLQEQLHQSEKLKSLGEMISGVAHELNNPLAAVIGFAQLLDQREIEEDVARKVAAIRTEASRCHGVVQELLRFARKQAPERKPVDLNSVIGSVVQLLGYQLQADGVTVDVDLDPAMRPVAGDFNALQQVFVNIIHNAHQAMREKGGRGVLRIVTRCDGLTCSVEVSDTGPGIRPEHLTRIFDPFFSTKGVGQGTGLGLSIVYSTVKAHGGEIYARSRPGRGATFVLEIPACASAEEAAIPLSVAPRMEPAAGIGRGPTGRILIVEDEVNIVEMMREALTVAGHVVDAAQDGVTASSMLRTERYDLIITDLKMPNMSGRELYDVVRDINPRLARRIIFSTGDSVSADTQAFFKETGNPCLTKPFDLRDLYQMVNSALRDA